jgi:hypothetical protein
MSELISAPRFHLVITSELLLQQSKEVEVRGAKSGLCGGWARYPSETAPRDALLRWLCGGGCCRGEGTLLSEQARAFPLDGFFQVQQW